MTARNPLRHLPLVVVLAGLTGCYSYQPIDEPAPGTVVRIQVPVRSAVVRPNEAPESVDFEGVVIATGDTLLLETESRREYGAFREILQLDTLRVARADLSSLEERLRDQTKTLAFTGVVVAGSVGLALAALSAVTGNEGGGKSGNDPTTTGGQIRLDPIFSGLLKVLGGG